MRLRHPTAGTVVHVAGDLAARMTAAGWVDVDAPVERAEKPAPRRSARKKSN